MGDAIILMYHRICRPSAETSCYFARGTAVHPEIFEAQLEWLRARFPIVSLSSWLTTRHEPAEPCVVLTFDDGYADILRLIEAGPGLGDLPFAIFPIAGHLGDSEHACWVDDYYAILHGAKRRESHDLLGFDAPPLDGDLRWWVRGPLKEKLQAMGTDAREQALDELAVALDAQRVPDLAHRLYLTRAELRLLAARSVEVGGHGLRHVRLTRCDATELEAELAGSAALLGHLAVERPVFCYPDGRHDPRIREAAARRGFVAGLTVDEGVATASAEVMALPRYLVRNRVAREPGWCSAFEGDTSQGDRRMYGPSVRGRTRV